jgi:hypothetical protein
MAGQVLSALALLFLVPLGIPATAQERPKAFLGASSKPSAPARFEPVLFEKSTLACRRLYFQGKCSSNPFTLSGVKILHAEIAFGRWMENRTSRG